MTKSELTIKLAMNFDISTRHARLIVDAIFDTMADTLLAGEKIILRGFGAFTVKVARSRVSRNPQTGAEIHVKARRGVSFKCSQTLHQRLNPGVP